MERTVFGYVRIRLLGGSFCRRLDRSHRRSVKEFPSLKGFEFEISLFLSGIVSDSAFKLHGLRLPLFTN